MKKKRGSRVASVRPSATVTGRFEELLRDQSLFLRLVLCGLALLGLLIAVEAWQAPFPYRLGDRPVHGICAQIAFKRVNEAATERARNERDGRVPHYFRHDPLQLQPLAARLRVHLGSVAQAESVDDLLPEVAEAFGLRRLGSEATSAAGSASEFATLKSALSRGDSSVGNRIDEIVEDFVEFTSVLAELGIVDEAELQRNQIGPDTNIAILSPDGTQTRTAIAGEVLLKEMIKDTGQLGKSWTLFPEMNQVRPMLETWLLNEVNPTLRYDADMTARIRQDVRNRIVEYDVYARNEPLVDPGETIDESLLGILRAEYETIEAGIPIEQRVLRMATAFAMFAVLAFLFGYYLRQNEPVLARSARRLAVYLASLVIAVGLARALSVDPWRAEIVPLMATVMILGIAYNPVLATLTAFAMTLVVTLSTVLDLGHFVNLMSVTATSIILLRRVSSRMAIIKVGFISACVYFFVSLGTGIIRNQSLEQLWMNSSLLLSSLKGAGWALVTSYFVAGSLPFIELVFGVVTDISLLEMSDISHPLLQELVRNAPGTYNHSISVATIGEAAADRIGANGLLVRVGAYFHDVGKMLKPKYFIENMSQGGASLHDQLAPAMSTLIIIGHVKDGVDLAEQYNLPQPIIDFIEQHHGTTLVEYFYREAARKAGEQPDHRTDAEESSFRYPGPKPQSREAGVMMLADAVESASRTLSDPTPKRIDTLVHDMTMKRLLDGQFDECPLTLKEIRAVEDSLIKSLIGIYHGRIKYPEQRSA